MIVFLRFLGCFGLGVAAIAFAVSMTAHDSTKPEPRRAAAPAIMQMSDEDINRTLVKYGVDPQPGIGDLARSTAALQQMSDLRAEAELDRREQDKDAAQAAYARTWRWRALAALLLGALAFGIAQRRARAQRPQVTA